jgi:hypothetical protein
VRTFCELLVFHCELSLEAIEQAVNDAAVHSAEDPSKVPSSVAKRIIVSRSGCVWRPEPKDAHSR